MAHQKCQNKLLLDATGDYRSLSQKLPRYGSTCTSIIHLFGILQTLNDSKPRYVSMDWTAAITDENQLKNQSSAVLAGK